MCRASGRRPIPIIGNALSRSRRTKYAPASAEGPAYRPRPTYLLRPHWRRTSLPSPSSYAPTSASLDERGASEAQLRKKKQLSASRLSKDLARAWPNCSNDSSTAYHCECSLSNSSRPREGKDKRHPVKFYVGTITKFALACDSLTSLQIRPTIKQRGNGRRTLPLSLLH